MKIQFVVQKSSGLSYHRLINPIEFMDWDEGDSAQMLWITQDEHLIDGDILYYNKFITMTHDRIAFLKKTKGIKVVVDVDDSWDLPLNHPFYKQWNAGNNSQRVIDNIKIADLVICTTMKLQEKVRQFNKNTAVIPNAFPFGHDCYKPIPVEKQKMTFIYVAGSTHLPDVELLRGKFKRIGNHSFINSNAEFILAGYEPTNIRQYNTKGDQQAQNNNYTIKKVNGVWDKMTAIFEQTNSFKIFGSTNLDEYINYYDYADVALVPLCDTEWNSYKSPLKIIEAAVKGIPVICSKVQPYSELIPCEGVIWIERPDQWIEYIKYCIKNPNYVKDMGNKLNSWVSEEYDLIKWNLVRKELFKSLMKC